MSERFIDAMRVLTGAVTIVTAGKGNDVAGLTATAVCSLSAKPARILVCLNRFGATFSTLLASGEFCVNILSAAQEALASEFAGTTGKTGASKFDDADWELSAEDSPRHARALATVRCRLHSMTVLETHAVVIGDVTQTTVGPLNASLLYRDRQFLHLAQ